MIAVSPRPKLIVAAIVATLALSLPAQAGAGQAAEVADLLAELEQADPKQAARLERELQLRWSKSGSSAMNLLLKRGTEAFERGDLDLALGHLSALIDHAPDFAQGWVKRAQVWHHKEELGLALSDLEHALSLQPNHFEALFGLSLVLEQLGHNDLALRGYRLVQQMHPHYDDAAEAIARLHRLVDGHAL